MSDIEIRGPDQPDDRDPIAGLANLGDVSTTTDAFDDGTLPLGPNLDTYKERQAEISGIGEREYRSDEQRVHDMNLALARMDDKFGVSYVSFPSGSELPGLQIHVPAQFITLTGVSAPGSSVEGSDLRGAVVVASDLEGLAGDRIKYDNAILLANNLNEAQMRDEASFANTILNFSEVAGLRFNGSRLSNTFMIAVSGLVAGTFEGVSTTNGSRILVTRDSEEEVDPDEVTAQLLGTRFASEDEEFMRSTRLPQIVSGLNLSERYLSGNRVQQGALVYRNTLTGATITDVQWNGGVFVYNAASELTGTGMNMSGNVVVNNKFGDSDLFGLWAPGGIHIANTWERADLTNINGAGGVWINQNMAGVTMDNPNVGGLITINTELPDMPEEVRSQVLQLESIDQLPGRVPKLLGRLVSYTAIKPTSDQPAIESGDSDERDPRETSTKWND